MSWDDLGQTKIRPITVMTLVQHAGATGLIRVKESWTLSNRTTSPMRTRNSVLVVEDFMPFRVFVSTLLRDTPDFQIISEASDGFEAVRRARELSPDLILMDIGLPGLNGLEAARQIREQTPRSRIIFLSQEGSAEVVEEALRAGAFGYIHKLRAGDDLFPAITAALEDQQFVSDGLLGSKEAIIQSSDARTHPPYLQKTPPLRSLRARP